MDFQIGLVIAFDCRFHRGHHWRRRRFNDLFYYGLVFRQQPLSELTYCMLLLLKWVVYMYIIKKIILIG
jgi:hypothetical protein